MHFVCSLYAFPYAYIFVFSALLLSQIVFLYALYAVNSGVVFLFSVHRLVFDCIQCIQTVWATRSSGTGENAYMPYRNVQ